MFSELSNQVSSWMGSAKDDEQEEHVPTRIENDTVVSNPENKQDSSPSKYSKMDVLNKIGGIGSWLGSGISKLMNGEEPQSAGEEVEFPASEKSVKESPVERKDDDDNSSFTRSATGSVDSNLVSESGTSIEETDVQFEAAFNKALLEAKSLGNILYSAVNKAGKTVSETGAKIKKSIEDNSILGEFKEEQDAFLKDKQANCVSLAVLPWEGCDNEEAMKEKCLSLTTDRRNFVRSPPLGIDFDFDYDVSYPIAIAMMAEDPNLVQMRFELVPKITTEHNFWRNYFYRVGLICQTNELFYVCPEGGGQSATDTGLFKKPSTSKTEFNSNSVDVVQMEEDIKILSTRETTEEEWENELETELQDYEVIEEAGKVVTVKNDFWNKDFEAMLDEDDSK